MIQFEIKVKKPDYLQVFYKDRFDNLNDSLLFSERQSQRIHLDSSDDFQIVRFQIPEGAIWNKLRIDFGRISENVWELKSLTISGKDQTVLMESPEILKYFLANSYLKRNLDESINLEYMTIKINQKCDPYLYSKKSIRTYLLEGRNRIISFTLFIIAGLLLIFVNRIVLVYKKIE